MFIDLHAPNYQVGDVVKIRGKRLQFKIKDMMEDEQGKLLYLVRSVQEYIIDEDQIEKLIINKT
jgi:hypothetical protein